MFIRSNYIELDNDFSLILVIHVCKSMLMMSVHIPVVHDVSTEGFVCMKVWVFNHTNGTVMWHAYKGITILQNIHECTAVVHVIKYRTAYWIYFSFWKFERVGSSLKLSSKFVLFYDLVFLNDSTSLFLHPGKQRHFQYREYIHVYIFGIYMSYYFKQV